MNSLSVADLPAATTLLSPPVQLTIVERTRQRYRWTATLGDVRVASWNLGGRTGKAAARLGAALDAQGGADLALLQEASPIGLSAFCEAAGLDWGLHIKDVASELLRVRGRSGNGRRAPRSVALAGRGQLARCPVVFPDLPLPEKVIAAWVDLDGVAVTVMSYHAPTGVQHKLKKPEQAVRVARWLETLDGPVIFGGDFNTPKLDPPDHGRVRTHWHTGDIKLGGQPGDDVLVGPDPVHGLNDALRVHLASHPDQLASIRAARPNGPLAISYRTGDAEHHRYRYDAIWVSRHFSVKAIDYSYPESIEAGTDHALVLADLEPSPHWSTSSKPANVVSL